MRDYGNLLGPRTKKLLAETEQKARAIPAERLEERQRALRHLGETLIACADLSAAGESDIFAPMTPEDEETLMLVTSAMVMAEAQVAEAAEEDATRASRNS